MTRINTLLTDSRRSLRCVSFLSIVDMFFIVFGSGISIGFAGYYVRSTTIDFPVIGLLVAGLIALLVGGQWHEAVLVFGALTVAGLPGKVTLSVVNHPLSKAHIDYAVWYKPTIYYGHEMVSGFEGFGPLNIPVKINEDGFRDGRHSRTKSPGVLRILGLGDSFMFGWGVQEGSLPQEA